MTMPSCPRAGFTLLELLVSLALFGLIASGFAAVTRAAGKTSEVQSTAFDLEAELFRVQDFLRRELRRSGYATWDGTAWPRTAIPGQLPGWAHAGAPGAPDARELAFLVPRDDDGDEWPDLDVNGAVQWRNAPAALLLRPAAGALHQLVYVDPDGDERVLSSRVLHMRAQTAAETGWNISPRSLRIELRLGRIDPTGRLLEREREIVLVLHNGGFDQ